MYSSPFVFDESESQNTEILTRIPFGKGFNEAWLQQRLFENPQSLPLSEINPAYQQVCPLCMEMRTGTGPIDIVYVTPHGQLVIVETKLWRNPEARRKVVGQILDYAKELSRWSYSDLQREVSRRTGIKGNAPYKLVAEQVGGVDEAAFVDGVSNSLETGNFMLLIAGDGIRKDTQGIVQFLQESGNLRFTLSLLEVAVYKYAEKDCFVIHPRILAKTEIIQRDLVGTDCGLPMNISESTVNDNGNQGKKDENYLQAMKDFWDRFLKDLVLDDPNQTIPNPGTNSNARFPLPPVGSVAWLNAFFSNRQKRSDAISSSVHQNLKAESCIRRFGMIRKQLKMSLLCLSSGNLPIKQF